MVDILDFQKDQNQIIDLFFPGHLTGHFTGHLWDAVNTIQEPNQTQNSCTGQGFLEFLVTRLNLKKTFSMENKLFFQRTLRKCIKL